MANQKQLEFAQKVGLEIRPSLPEAETAELLRRYNTCRHLSYAVIRHMLGATWDTYQDCPLRSTDVCKVATEVAKDAKLLHAMVARYGYMGGGRGLSTLKVLTRDPSYAAIRSAVEKHLSMQIVKTDLGYELASEHGKPKEPMFNFEFSPKIFMALGIFAGLLLMGGTYYILWKKGVISF